MLWLFEVNAAAHFLICLKVRCSYQLGTSLGSREWMSDEKKEDAHVNCFGGRIWSALGCLFGRINTRWIYFQSKTRAARSRSSDD